jgi:OPT oligopeptide transporter protein.
MANAAVEEPYALGFLAVTQAYYDINLGYWFDLVLVLGTQVTGFGIAGLCRRFLVWPASMVWPQNLVTCALFNTLHANDDGVSGITRYKFFIFVIMGSFFFFFLPGRSAMFFPCSCC